jgi:hypothetical protein
MLPPKAYTLGQAILLYVHDIMMPGYFSKYKLQVYVPQNNTTKIYMFPIFCQMHIT